MDPGPARRARDALTFATTGAIADTFLVAAGVAMIITPARRVPS